MRESRPNRSICCSLRAHHCRQRFTFCLALHLLTRGVSPVVLVVRINLCHCQQVLEVEPVFSSLFSAGMLRRNLRYCRMTETGAVRVLHVLGRPACSPRSLWKGCRMQCPRKPGGFSRVSWHQREVLLFNALCPVCGPCRQAPIAEPLCTHCENVVTVDGIIKGSIKPACVVLYTQGTTR